MGIFGCLRHLKVIKVFDTVFMWHCFHVALFSYDTGLASQWVFCSILWAESISGIKIIASGQPWNDFYGVSGRQGKLYE